MSKYLVIGIQNICTHTERKRGGERHFLFPSLSLSHSLFYFFLSFLFFFFYSLFKSTSHFVATTFTFFFTRTFNIHSCEFTQTYTYIHRSLLRCIFTERLIYTIPLSIAASSTIWFGMIIWSRSTYNYGSSNINMIQLKEPAFISI
jgi:hypothetical protein